VNGSTTCVLAPAANFTTRLLAESATAKTATEVGRAGLEPATNAFAIQDSRYPPERTDKCLSVNEIGILEQTEEPHRFWPILNHYR
jgi:hypothetical protein